MNNHAIPPRSWLFHVPLLGRGTGQVECLASFVSRVSEEHLHRPSGLLHRGLEWHAIGQPEMAGRWLKRTKQLKMGWSINGHPNGRRWIEVIESTMMTSNIQEATISRWSHPGGHTSSPRCAFFGGTTAGVLNAIRKEKPMTA